MSIVQMKHPSLNRTFVGLI